jgi:AcrR family transcriptional regulator
MSVTSCHGHVMTQSVSGLRKRQTELARDAILDSLLERLELEEPGDISLPQIARDAGLSVRTLYRYFPTRDALFDAAGEQIAARLGLPTEIDGADGISASFLSASAQLAKRPRLARALLRTTAGREVRTPNRSRRVEAIESALAELSAGLDDTQARHASAVMAYLCNSAAWITICDETGISADEARASVAWAIDVLVAKLRQQSRKEHS